MPPEGAPPHQPDKPGLTRRRFLAGAGTAVGITGLVFLAEAALNARRVPQLYPVPTETAETPSSSSLLKVENGQIVRGEKTNKTIWGATGPNIYSILNIINCGSPSPVSYDYQKAVVQAARRQQEHEGQDVTAIRGWHFATEGPPYASQKAFENLLQVAEENDIHLILALSGNYDDGCRQNAKAPGWYAGGYRNEHYLSYIADAERSTHGSNRVIWELSNEIGNGITVNPGIVNEYLKAGAGTLQSLNSNRLVTASLTSSNFLAQPDQLEQILAGNPINLLDLHFYPPDTPEMIVGQVQTAQAHGIPVFLGEVGIPTTANHGEIQQYKQFFGQLIRNSGVAGAMPWGQTLVDPHRNILYQTSDPWYFSPNSPQASLFREFTPSFAHPSPNAANARAGIR